MTCQWMQFARCYSTELILQGNYDMPGDALCMLLRRKTSTARQLCCVSWRESHGVMVHNCYCKTTPSTATHTNTRALCTARTPFAKPSWSSRWYLGSSTLILARSSSTWNSRHRHSRTSRPIVNHSTNHSDRSYTSVLPWYACCWVSDLVLTAP